MVKNGIAGIDHVIIAVRDLERARSVWTRLGFAPTPRGRHIGRGTANYCIMFASNYLELMGIVDAADGVERLAGFLTRREGPMAAAFAPAGTAEEARAALLARQLHPSEPRALARRIELPEGEATPRFSLVTLPPEETPGLDSFLCSHLTPELMRQPEWLAHPNGANRLDAIHLLVDSTTPLLPAYDRLFGIVQVTTTDAVATVHVGRQRIVCATPDDFRTMHPGLDLDRAFPLPGIAAIELATSRLEDTANYLTRAQIAFIRMPDGDLAVPAGETTGAIVLFTEG
jgi:catechol 2,3-dioxygenase-like lactoylglutathione lyase family enzyme